MGGQSSMAQEEPRLGGLRVQTSCYGLVVPVVLGRNRVTGNLLWYGGFKAIRQEEYSEAGKGGSAPARTYYVYAASIAMALAEGPILGVRTVWKGKQRFTGEDIADSHRDKWADYVVTAEAPTVTVPGLVSLISVTFLMNERDGQSSTPMIEGQHYTKSGNVLTFDLATYPWLRPGTIHVEWIASDYVAAKDGITQLGLTLRTGLNGQPVWSYLSTNAPSDAIGYSGIAYVFGQDYPLKNDATVENHSFEIDGRLQVDPATNPDCVPADVALDLLLNTQYGVAFPPAFVGDTAAYRAYTNAFGLFVSPVFNEQRPAREWLSDILRATNTEAAWSGSALRFVPRGDKAAGSYVPATTPVYDFSPDDFAPDSGADPVEIERVGPTDRRNVIKVEYTNRGADYAIQTVEATDEDAIALVGRRPAESTYTWHFFCTADAARQAAEIVLQREQAAIATYRWRAPFRFVLAQLGDLVTLTEPKQRLSRVPVMITRIEESDDDHLLFEAKSFPIGHANAAIIPPQLGSGFNPNMNADPGPVVAPVLFEPPGSLIASGLEVWIAATGASQNWGGAEVYVSLDGGSSYKRVGRIRQSCRYGTLTGALGTSSGATLPVQLAGRGGTLQPVSGTEANALATLCYVGDPADGEYLSFQTATLTGANAYTLGALTRGRFGTAAHAVASGKPFVYVDGAIATSGALPLSMVGKTIKVKLCSFNVFGGALQSLSEVTEYSYTITGRFASQALPPSGKNLLQNAALGFGLAGLKTTALGISPDPYAVTQEGGAANAYIPGSPTNAWIYQGGATANGYIEVYWPAVSVEPGDRIAAFAFLRPENCTGYVQVNFHDKDGAIISQVGPTVRVSDPVAPVGYLNVLADYQRSGMMIEAPAGAAKAFFRIVKFGTAAGHASSLLSFTRPFFGKVQPEQVDFPEWDAGQPHLIDSTQIATGAATVVKVSPMAAGTLRNQPYDNYVPGIPAPAGGWTSSAAGGNVVVTADVDCDVEISAMVTVVLGQETDYVKATLFGNDIPGGPVAGPNVSRYVGERQPGASSARASQTIIATDTLKAGQTRTYYLSVVGNSPTGRFVGTEWSDTFIKAVLIKR